MTMTLEERRRQAERAARARLAARREEEALRAAEPPTPGDLLWLPATAGLPVEWLLARLEGDEAVLVPADLNPQVGAADLAVAGEAGPLTLRTAHAVRLPAARLAECRRTGRLGEPELEAVRARLAAPDPTMADEDEDLELRDWLADAVIPARQALAPTATVPASPPAARPSRPWRRRLEVAAAALLAAGLALAGSQVWNEGRLRRLEAEKARAVARYEGRVAELTRRVEAGEQEGREARRLRDELRRLATPPGAPSVRTAAGKAPAVEPLLNPRIEWFQPAADTVRGEERRLAVPPGAERVFFVLETWSTRPFPRYRVELQGGKGGEPLWKSDGLVAQGSSEIVFGLPASRLPAGPYVFQLYGLAEEGPQALESFPFRVE